MSKKNQSKFNATIKNDNVTPQKSTLNQEKITIINKLKEKYGISDDEAEYVLNKLEKKSKKSEFQIKIQPSNIQNSKNIPITSKKSSSNKQSDISDFSKINQNIFTTDKIQESSIEPNNMPNIAKDTTLPPGNQTSVDDIMMGLIPGYNQQIAIELDDVSLKFEVTHEKIDTIKESFIRFVKRAESIKTEINALQNISLKIYKGEKVGIIGYNGAGKSTLLKVISGIYSPNQGIVRTYGNISPLLSLGAGFDYNYSGRKNIYLNGAIMGYEKEFLESKIDEIIEFSELGEYIDIPIKNYSSGMLAKLGFAIAVAVNPDILIIDEILGVGDVNFKKKSHDKIKSLMDGKTTVLLVSHSIPQIREICDKAIWIDNGKAREVGDVNKVCDHYIKDSEKASNEQLANIQFK